MVASRQFVLAVFARYRFRVAPADLLLWRGAYLQDVGGAGGSSFGGDEFPGGDTRVESRCCADFAALARGDLYRCEDRLRGRGGIGGRLGYWPLRSASAGRKSC